MQARNRPEILDKLKPEPGPTYKSVWASGWSLGQVT